jgi:hypothetical protein
MLDSGFRPAAGPGMTLQKLAKVPMGKQRSSKTDKPTSPATGTREAGPRAPTRRHPLFGALKGLLRVMPGTDLTKPADQVWGQRKVRAKSQKMPVERRK